MKANFNFPKDPQSLIITAVCLMILVAIPVYWLFFVPPALELQEIRGDGYTASGYFSPGGYFNLTITLENQSIQGFNYGQLIIIPNLTSDQKARGVWQPTSMSIEEWPGSKSEINYNTNDKLNKNIIVYVTRVDIPNQTELSGETVPIVIKYDVDYPYQTYSTEILGGTVSNFREQTGTVEKTVTVELGSKIITKSDLNAIIMNESWKKAASSIIWIFDLLFLLSFYTDFRAVKMVSQKFVKYWERFMQRIREL